MRAMRCGKTRLGRERGLKNANRAVSRFAQTASQPRLRLYFGRKAKLRARLSRWNPGRPRGFKSRRRISSTRPAWRYHVPPNLVAQYQRLRNCCQAKKTQPVVDSYAPCQQLVVRFLRFFSRRARIASPSAACGCRKIKEEDRSRASAHFSSPGSRCGCSSHRRASFTARCAIRPGRRPKIRATRGKNHHPWRTQRRQSD